ncbi:MAG: 2Fe-2S iron-sulfur cluster-binding protein [Pseudomonadota bacterium]|nr:2Fe-2S iron-sulfur cluster-binding protein [Pseudomonadota bacterium]
MTPWGIRNRLKGLVGGSTAASKREESLTLHIVLPTGKEYEVKAEPRYTIVMASQTLETPIATGCPDGGCGGCTVEVLDGTGLAPPTAAEQKLLDEKWKGKPNFRLACHARITGSGARVKAMSVWTMDTTRGT